MRLWRLVQWPLSPFPRRPNRRYDLISETITTVWRRWEQARPRNGGVTSDRSESKKRSAPAPAALP